MTDETYADWNDDQPPTAPDGTALTPEEWDAVRRLRGERAATPPAPAASTAPAAAPPEEPARVQAAPEQPALLRRDRGTQLRGLRPSGALTAVSVLLVLAIFAATLVALVTAHLSARRSAGDDATNAIAAATAGVATVLSYNYRSLDSDFTKAESLLTPSFRKTYITTTAKAVQPLAAKYKAVSSAQVTAAGVVSSGSGHIQVLVFVEQTVTNSQLAKPRLDRSRINVDLVHRGGSWLINRLAPV